jgi:hypothetical protein
MGSAKKRARSAIPIRSGDLLPGWRFFENDSHLKNPPGQNQPEWGTQEYWDETPCGMATPLFEIRRDPRCPIPTSLGAPFRHLLPGWGFSLDSRTT